MIASGLCSYRSLFVRVTCWPYMADQPPSVTTELTLLSRVAYRDREINGPRLRGLLALLAGDLRTGCSAARLMEGLWPDEQPENPAKALQILVSRARAQLGSDVIASTPTGYRLSLREDQVDTSAVLLSASASARCSRAGDHAAALAHAEEGLALWEGDAGGDAAFDDPVSALREERGSTYRSLVRARALALSRLGRHAEATEALADLVGERPRDEELLLELLRSEAATVGPSAALARYESYRRSLRDELGTDPGPALQALHQQLLQGTSPVVRHGVPHEPNPLLGRDDDIAAVANLLRNPLLILLLAAAAVSAATGDPTDGAIIAAIVGLSVGLGFVNEYRSELAVAALHAGIRHQALVWRDGSQQRLDVRDLVPGDVVALRVGDLVPADLRLLEADQLECDEAVLTGEPIPAVKTADPVPASDSTVDLPSCAFMGTVVHQGAGRGVVVATGSATAFGKIAAGLAERQAETGFQAGLRGFSKLLVKIAAVLTTSIFVINLALHRPLLDTLLFSLAIAIGITPQLLPAVVSVSLSTGSRQLARRRVLVKRLVTIEDLGNIEVLFTDKTGTL